MENFGALLERYRTRAALSRNALAREAGCDASYITRTASGDREPPRFALADALARALRLNPFERNQFLMAAGHVPPALTQLGGWNATLQAVCDVLSDSRLDPEDRAAFTEQISALASLYRRLAEARTAASVAAERRAVARFPARTAPASTEAQNAAARVSAPLTAHRTNGHVLVQAPVLACPHCGGAVLADAAGERRCVDCGR